MAKLSVLYITRNEEALLARSLASIRGIADEIVVVDTGSVDKTLSVCRQFKARILAYSWVHDFSKPRNYGLSNCKGDWVLCLDADEMLDPRSASVVRAAVNEAKPNVVGYDLHIVDHPHDLSPDAEANPKSFFPSPQARLFRRLPGVFFRGKVAESARADLSKAGGIDILGASVHHWLWRGKGEEFSKMKLKYYEKLGAALAPGGDRLESPGDRTPPPAVAIAVVAFNAVDHTKRCLASVASHVKVPYQLCLIDNGSRDATATLMREATGMSPVSLKANVGVAKGKNMAAVQGLSTGAPYICFLDNDAELTEGAMEAMIAAMEANPSAAIVGPTTDSGPQAQPHVPGSHECALASSLDGFCMLARASVLKDVGLFDESFGIYGYEDKDLCRRMAAAGHQLLVALGARVKHAGGGTTRANHANWHAILATARVRYEQKWGEAARAKEAPPAPISSSRSAPAVKPRCARGEAPRASVVIIAHNRRDVTVPCLEHLARNTPPFELVFVDNGSTDGTADYVASVFPDAKLIRNDRNLGVPVARNQGLEATTCQKIVVMDNDVFVENGWLEVLEEASKNAEIAGIEAWKLNSDWQACKKCTEAGEPFDYIGGACTMFDRRVFEEVGLLDEGFSPAYYEDVDINIRARQAGMRQTWVQTNKIRHREHQTLVHGQRTFNYAEALDKSYQRFFAKMTGRLKVEHKKLGARKIRLLYLGMQHDYGHRDRGNSFEHDNFFPALSQWGRVGAFSHFDFVDVGKERGVPKMSDMLTDEVARFRPDLMFCVFFDEGHDPRRDVVRRITESTQTVTVGWFCDSHWRYQNFDRRWADSLTHCVTTSTVAHQRYIVDGLEKKVIKSQWGASPKYRKIDSQGPVAEVSFVGQPHGDRKAVIDRLRRAGIDVQVYGTGWGGGTRRLEFEEMVGLFGRSRINLNLSNACDASYKQIKGRNFEVPACGGFLLTGVAENLHEYYELGKEVAVYSSADDMIEKIRHYLGNEGERAAVAAAGHSRTMRDHTYEKRLEEIFGKTRLAHGP
jgi:GT2 family glycosyltransferase